MVRKDLIFRVFVSSPFTDMVAERNALQRHAFPGLRDYCRGKGARFQAIDLRWGIGHEASLDQQLTNICTEELRRCQRLSPRPNFIVMLGDRYGYRPLPPKIAALEFETILDLATNAHHTLLLKWYRRDDNAVPAEYCLQPRQVEFIDADRWRQEEEDLRGALLSAIEGLWDPEDPRAHKYVDSATHLEIRRGALEAERPQSHVFCYFRRITNLPADDTAGQFLDIRNSNVDEKAQDRLRALKSELTELLPMEHVHHYEAKWEGDSTHCDLAALCRHVSHDLRRVIDEELELFVEGSEVEREIEAHRVFAEDHSRTFRGRQQALARIDEYLTSSSTQPLVVHGASGSGKSALMAAAWLRQKQRRNAIARFVGATPASANIRLLLTGLCHQLGVSDVPTEPNTLLQTFRGVLTGEGKVGTGAPLLLFLDAIDQLNPEDRNSALRLLPRKLAPNVKLLVSLGGAELVSPSPGDLGPEHDSFVDAAKRIWPDTLYALRPLDDAVAAKLLDTWLREAGRTLQPKQHAAVLEGYRVCRLPLYLKLAFEEARRWKSWDHIADASEKHTLSDSVEGTLADFLTRLEEPRFHGQVLVSHALGYIAAGRHGLTEDEILDVLSTDVEVMEEFRTRSPGSPRVGHLPVVVWSRLLAEIEPYIIRRRADGTVVLNFNHRQVGLAVRRRFLRGAACARAHLHLAQYFHEQDYWAEPQADQRARALRLPPTPRQANVRKVIELPYHRLQAAKILGEGNPQSPYWDAVVSLLTEWQFLEAKAEADPDRLS